MRSIWKLFAANMRYKRGAFTGICILMMLLTLSYAITVSNNDNLTRSIKETLAHDNIGDMTFNFFEPATPAMEAAMKKHSEIREWHQNRGISVVKPPLADGKEYSYSLSLACEYESMLMFNETRDGFREGPIRLKEGEICLPYMLSLQPQFAVGKKIEFATREGTTETFTVCGYFQTTGGTGTAIISKADHERFLRDHMGAYEDSETCFCAFTELHISVEEGTDLLALKKALCKECADFENAYFFSTAAEAVDSEMLLSSIGSKILAVFVVMLLIIVMIVIANSVGSAIETEYVNLGILKAQGFGTGTLQIVWVMQYTLALLLGTVLGLLAAAPLTKLFGGLFINLTGILTVNDFSLGECCLYALLIIAVCIAYVCIMTAKLGKISPIRAISGGRGAEQSAALRTPIRKGALSLTIAVRQFTSRLKHNIGTTIIAALLAFFVCTIIVLGSGMGSDLLTMPLGDIELRLSEDFKPEQGAKIEELCKKYDPEARVLLWTGRQMLVDDSTILVEIYSDPKTFTPPLRGHIPQKENEATLTEVFAKLLGKDIGDTVTIKVNGKSADYVITGVFQTLLGNICEITNDGGKRLGFDRPDMGYVMLNDKQKNKEIAEKIEAELSDLTSAVPLDADKMLEDTMAEVDLILDIVLLAIYLVSMLFAAVVVSMNCSRTFLMERTDIGIFKAIGFSLGKLRLQFALRFTVISMFGTLIGCGISAVFSEKLVTLLLGMLGISQFTADLTAKFVLLPLITFGAAFFLFSYVAARHIKTISVRELITE